MENKTEFKTKSVILSRKGKKETNQWNILLALFDQNNPNIEDRVPVKVLEFKGVEKVRLKDLVNVSFYTTGGDLVINDLKNISAKQEKNVLTLSGQQTI